MDRLQGVLGALLVATVAGQWGCRAQPVAPLPAGVEAVWDTARAYRETTPTPQSVSASNGLWRWQPAAEEAEGQYLTATGAISRFPACWPGITDYMQKDCQTLFAHPGWRGRDRSGGRRGAWYQREIAVAPPTGPAAASPSPPTNLNSYAAVYLDGTKSVTCAPFPPARWDLTAALPAAAAGTC